jgi:hypothetical protein
LMRICSERSKWRKKGVTSLCIFTARFRAQK